MAKHGLHAVGCNTCQHRSKKFLSNGRKSQCKQVPQLPRNCKTKVGVAKCHTCHAKRRWTLPSAAAPRATNGDQARDQIQPSAISATPPHKTKVDVGKRHTCHAKCRGARATNGDQARHQIQPSAISATPATQKERRCRQGLCVCVTKLCEKGLCMTKLCVPDLS